MKEIELRIKKSERLISLLGKCYAEAESDNLERLIEIAKEKSPELYDAIKVADKLNER